MRACISLVAMSILSVPCLAGDVSAKVKHGDLIVTGPFDDCYFVIDGNALGPGQARFTPSPGTTVNGSAAPVIVSGMTRDLIVNASSGIDQIEISKMRVFRDLILSLGAGDDAVAVSDTKIERNAKLSFGTGINAGSLNGVALLGRLTCRGGPEFDFLDVKESSIGGKVDVRLGDGVGVVNLLADMPRAVRVRTGSGDDSIALWSGIGVPPARLDTGDGADTLLLGGEVRGAMRVAMGGDADVFYAQDTTFESPARVDLGDGSDLLDLWNCELESSARFAGGRDADTFSVLEDHAGSDLTLDFGSGSGSLQSTNTVCERSLTILDVADLSLQDVAVGRDLRVRGAPKEGLEAILLGVSTARDLDVRGRGANDALGATDQCSVHGDTRIRFGPGNNSVKLPSFAVTHDLRIVTGDGDDTIDIGNAVVGGATKVQHGGGNDVVQ